MVLCYSSSVHNNRAIFYHLSGGLWNGWALCFLWESQEGLCCSCHWVSYTELQVKVVRWALHGAGMSECALRTYAGPTPEHRTKVGVQLNVFMEWEVLKACWCCKWYILEHGSPQASNLPHPFSPLSTCKLCCEHDRYCLPHSYRTCAFYRILTPLQGRCTLWQHHFEEGCSSPRVGEQQ